MPENVNIDLIVKNDVEWRKHLIDMQQKTFNKIDEIKTDFSNQKILCENRITKIETESKANAKIYGIVFGVFAGAVVGIITSFGKWLINKLSGVVI